jgi:hypothetical protein
LNKANITKDSSQFLDLDISLAQCIFNARVYDERANFYFPIVNFPFLDGDVALAPSHGVYISQLVDCNDISDDFSDLIS